MTLEGLLEELNISFKRHGEHHHTTLNHVQIDCPFCSDRTGKFRMGIRIDSLVPTCWTCGYHRLGDVLSQSSGVPIGEVLRSLETLGKPSRIDSGRSLKRKGLRTPIGVGPLREPHRRYLEERGFDPDHLTRLWGIKGIGIHSHLQWRIWIPVVNQGEVVSWTSRGIGERSIRYISARPDQEKVPLKSLLYGRDYVRHTAIICEGPTDVWRIGPGAVATLGVITSSEQVEQISKIPRRVICFDPDESGKKKARELMSKVKCFPGETCIIEIESGEDVASANEEEVDLIREEFLE